MRVLMMTNTYLPHVGGVARSVASFTETLRAGGHPVMVVAPTFEGAAAGEDPTEPGVLRVPALQRFNGSDFSVRLPIPGLVTAAIDRFAPDVVHAHHPFLMGDTALRTATRRNLPLVFTHHTMYERYTHYVPGHWSRMARFVVSLATEYANLCDLAIAPSEKSPELLAHGVGRFLQTHDDAHFLVVGDGPAREQIHAVCAERGVADRLHMPGTLSGEALVAAYGAMDVFAFTSQTETQGLVLAEAMAAGVPVVATEAPGSRDIVVDGRNGRLLPPSSDEAALAEALAGVTEADPQARATLRAGARETAKGYSLEACSDRLLAAYQRAAGSPPQRREVEENPWAQARRLVEAEWHLWSGRSDAALQSLRGRASSVPGAGSGR